MEGRGSVWISWNVKRCSGILWVLLLIGSVSSTCPDADNQTMACDVLPVDGLFCSYVKGSPQDTLIDGSDVPSKVAKLNAAPGFAPPDINGQCGTRLNVTWSPSYDGGLKYLRGFFLVMSFFYQGKTYFINRTFNLSGTNLTGTNLQKAVSQTVFRHECVVPVSNTLYHIELHSLPRNDQSHPLTIDYLTSTTTPSNNFCDRTGDPNYTFNWTATMWASQNAPNSSIEVCFYTAPQSYNFSSYYIDLLPNPSGLLNEYVERKNVTVDLFKKDAVCQRFLNICSGVYKIWVTPVNYPVGTCHNGDERTSCTATVIELINMTESVCTASTPPGISVSTPITTPTYASVVPDSASVAQDNAKIAGIVIGISLAVILVAVLAGVFCLRKRRSRPEKPPICGLEANSITGPSYPIEDQQIVLIVYSSDNEYHRKVVRNFAAFLHSCCKCDVRFDDWSQVDISQTNALDWLTKQLHQAKHIIFINSLGAFMQQKAWMEGATCSPVKELLLPDMFIPALRQVQSRVYEKPPTKRLQYYHVYFPYTDVKELLDVSFGQRYKLMKHIEDLFLNIHGMTKYSEIGQTSALQINAHSYMGSAEGQALLSAIDEACASVKRNPNWFAECYTYQAPSMEKEVTLINYSPANGDIHHNNDGQPITGETSVEGDSYDSIGSNATRRKSSDEGVHIYHDIIPPSSSGSCISNMDRRSGSLDIGFGDTIDSSSTFDPNSPSVLLGFRPPIPDDDETTSIGSHMFFDKLNELNEQYDSGIPFSSFELKPSDRSSC